MFVNARQRHPLSMAAQCMHVGASQVLQFHFASLAHLLTEPPHRIAIECVSPMFTSFRAGGRVRTLRSCSGAPGVVDRVTPLPASMPESEVPEVLVLEGEEEATEGPPEPPGRAPDCEFLSSSASSSCRVSIASASIVWPLTKRRGLTSTTRFLL